MKNPVSNGIHVLPGWRLCWNWQLKVENIFDKTSSSQSDKEKDVTFARINDALTALEESHVNLRGVPSHQRVVTARCKIQKAVSKIEEGVA